MVVYGIPNCDTIKKTLAWLQQHHIPYTFHDYKKQGITKTKLAEWCSKEGWEMLLNKKSATWRSLSTDEQQQIKTQAAAIKTMLENNSIIKRPVVEFDGRVIVGFNEENFSKHLK